MAARKLKRGTAAIVRHIAGYTNYVGCGCRGGEEFHDPKNVNGCARAHFASLLRELRPALKEGR